MIVTSFTPVPQNIFDLWKQGWRVNIVAHLCFVGTASGLWQPALPAPPKRLLITHVKRARANYPRLATSDGVLVDVQN